jgi:hypothetical protein
MQRSIAVLCAVFLCSSCGKNNSVGSGGSDGYSVPYLASGTETFVTTSTTTDSLNNIIFQNVDTEVVRIEGVGETVGGYFGLARVSAYSRSDSVGLENEWYKADNDSLVDLAYSMAAGVPNILPKSNAMPVRRVSPLGIPQVLWQTILKKAAADSVFVRDAPRVVLRFPLTPGRWWVSTPYPFGESRQVVGNEVVRVKAGAFVCTKIRTTISFAGDSLSLEWYDYVALEGLVLRTFSMPSYRVTTEAGPDSGFTASYLQRVELVSRY